MANVSYHISNLLEKMTSSDKDFRFMATNDLMTELQKDSIKLDDDSERKVIKMLLKLLEDKNGEVQNLAVKCLGPLVGKVKEYQIESIVDTLCNNMLSDKEQLRDISSIGLKTVITELPTSNYGTVGTICKKITNRLTSAISKQTDESVQLEALDILGDLLSKHGGLLSNFHSQVKDSLLPLLKSPRMAVRKRAITAIGHLVITCSQTTFTELVSHLVTQLKGGDNIDSKKLRQTYVQCTGAIARQAGHRIGQYLVEIMPLVSTFCKKEQENDELKEHCIQICELFVRKCPLEVTPYISDITNLCLEYLTYDPNYNYDSDDDDVENGMDDDDDLDVDDDDDLDDYSDDDDMSWKVRRASAKCIEAVVSTRHELLVEFYKNVSQPLISRFKEREENVKSDVFAAYISLVRHTRNVLSSSTKSGEEDISMETEDTPLSLLAGQVPSIVKAIYKNLKDKSVKTRQCCFSLLTQLALTFPGCLSEHLVVLMPGIQHCLSGDRHNTSNLKIDTLNFVHVLLTHHDPEVIHPFVSALVPAIVQTAQDPFYKITSDALLVMQDLVKVICHGNLAASPESLIKNLYDATFHRLKASDIDQEVKERAITCMGQILASAGDKLASHVPETLEIFLDRLKNEITRLTTVRALHTIASPEKPMISLNNILARAMPIMANFLRKNQRSLRIATLRCLESIFTNYPGDITVKMIHDVEQELAPLINENDLHITQLAIRLLSLMINTPAASAGGPNWPSPLDARPNLTSDILPTVYVIVQSSLLQGGALKAVLDFFKTLVTCQAARSDGSEISFHKVLRKLIEPIYVPEKQTKQQARASMSPPPSAGQARQTLSKQAYHSTAKCISALTHACPEETDNIVRQFVMDTSNPKSSDSIRTFAVLSIGEIGLRVDLSPFPDIEKVIMKAFAASSEEVKSAASFSLGRVSIGNLQHYLPILLKEIHNQPKSQYLLLHALKETISLSEFSVLEKYVVDIWKLLFKHCECEEEGTRNVVAECLGKLTLIHPTILLPELRQNLTSTSVLVRATVVTAFKFTITDQPTLVDALLKECIGEFLALLLDGELNVRRVTLTMLNSAAHNKPALIRDLLPEILPHLYNETKIRTELIREVLMGPFKHTVDDGLDVRKAAFECMYTLLDTCVQQLDIFEFLKYVENGLKDSYDIKMLTFLMLVRLAGLCPNVVLQHLDKLIEPLRATCAVKVKADSVKQEFEKQDELKRSALRAVHALLNIPEADKSPVMSEFLAQVRSSAELSSMFESVQKDSTATSLTASTSVETMDTS
ncbi:cullin-associated NEDD8-dissociated protein 1-like [Styela clava]